MTDEDKKRIAEYMNDEGALYNCAFDCNYASLCVQEMQKRGDWEYFVGDIEDTLNFFAATYKRYHKEHHSYKAVLVAWLFNAENFFNAMAQWIKEGKK